MSVTLKNIAEETGLSVTTISLVINGKGASIPAKTQKRVLDAVKRLNYRPNQLAVGLVKHQTKTVGLLVQDIANSYFAAVAKGVEDACHEEGWTMMLCNIGDFHEREVEYIKLLESKGIDGFIVGRPSGVKLKQQKELEHLLNKVGLPYLLIGIESPYGYVRIDSEQGGYLAMEHLIKLGHKRLGCITGPQYMRAAIDRLEGAKRAMADYGLDPTDMVLYEGNYRVDGGFSGIVRMLDEGVTGIFVSNDMMALGAYKYCVERGIRIPDDISLVGFDDVYFADIMERPLTTIHIDNEEVGRALGKTLINAIKGEKTAEDPMVFIPRLVIRGTTTKPKA